MPEHAEGLKVFFNHDDQLSNPVDHASRRTLSALAPRLLVRELAGQIQAEALDRGAQMDWNRAELAARRLLALPGIGRAIFDAYYGGTGVIARVDGRRFVAIDPARIRMEAPDGNDQEGRYEGQAQDSGQDREQAPLWRRALDLFPGLRHGDRTDPGRNDERI